ncbi:MAG: Asp-tRNA(Asn)/Glu-tRNA(Gln) amidotransferase subunit GatB [Nitrospirae bacterium]|nr:Asp-tRNA(Asn)/Glu-tRNA(Gln) amidotransferase subunit GatB [Nitrospirota bacterium]MBI3351843.1 Asp-tRNA(Asn)/Glu-tRNA(Gln) amidotransferase subunit GatB [Nitrospirota bacterium]
MTRYQCIRREFMKYEAVIGLEVHAQMLTHSKIFCGCSTSFGSKPNSQTCPVCLGMPGVLPVLNKKVVEFAMRTALATHCTISPLNRFARKNYFYPDLPKGYQISQYELPLAEHGHIDIQVDGVEKRIRLTRIHLEEDAGKNLHEGIEDASYIDLNRTGVPLMEIVSEPDIRSSEEAVAYLKKLRNILVYLEVNDGNLEEGSFRCDANVSIRPVGQEKFGTRTELKNINSFRFIQKAIDYEIKRQEMVLEEGGRIIQETRLWDTQKGITVSMRSKESAHDYRYFPEPDLVPVKIHSDWVEEIQKTLPELPDAKKERFIKDYQIPPYDASVLTQNKKIAFYFEECASLYHRPKAISNWIMGDLLNEEEIPISPRQLTGMIELIDKGVISGKIAKTVFEEMLRTKKDARTIVEEKGLLQVSDDEAILSFVDQVLNANPESVEQYRSGKERLLGFFVGQVMKISSGKANPGKVNELLLKRLKNP